MGGSFCPQCGNPVNPGDAHCQHCGAALMQSATQQSYQQQPQQTYQQQAYQQQSYQQQAYQQQPQQSYQQQAYQQQPQQAYQQPYPGQVMPNGAVSDKNWVVALLLCLFLGGAGIHRFYLGYTGRGIAHIILLVLGIALTFVIVGIVLDIIVGIMALVDFFMLLFKKLPDSDGRPLQ